MFPIDLFGFTGIFISGLCIGGLELMCGVGYTLLLPPLLLLFGFDPISVICATTATQAVFSLLLQVQEHKPQVSTFRNITAVPLILLSTMAALAGVLLLRYLPADAIKLQIVLMSMVIGGILLAIKDLRRLTFANTVVGVGVHSFLTGLTGIGIAAWGRSKSADTDVERALKAGIINTQTLVCAIVALICVGYKPQSSVGLFSALVFSAVAAVAAKQFFVVSETNKYRTCMGVVVIIISLLTALITIL